MYLDNNATTRLDPRVLDVMMQVLGMGAANPSSLHHDGRKAQELLDDARRKVAGLLGTTARRVLFTASGSEADNLAIKGVALAAQSDGRFAGRRRILAGRAEHPAVRSSLLFLERQGWSVTWLPVDCTGRIEPEVLEEALDGDVLLVSVMTANNETGTLNPIAELAAAAHRYGALLHTDAVQAAGRVPLDVTTLDVDLLTLSSHKLHGPTGAGALYVRPGVPLEPVVHGGLQERGLRAGTENVAAVAAFGTACQLSAARLSQMGELARLRDRLEEGIRTLLPDARLNGNRQHRLPNTLNLTLPGIRGESLVIAMDQKGVALSSGSACKSGSPDPSPALLAMGLSPEEAHCSVRFSLSTHNTVEEIERTLRALHEVVTEMANTVRFLACR